MLAVPLRSQLIASIHWTPNVYNEELFRVFEYGAM